MMQGRQFIGDVYARTRPTGFSMAGAVVARLFGGGARPPAPTHQFARLPEPGPGAWGLNPGMSALPYSIAAGGYIVQDNGVSQVLSGPQVMWAPSQMIIGYEGVTFGGTYQQGLIDWQSYADGRGAPPAIAGG